MASTRAIRLGRRAVIVAGVVGMVLALAGSAFAAIIPLTTVSTDPYTNTSSFHQTELEPDTFSFGATTVGTFQVGRFSDGGSSNLGWATTTDDGTTWSHGFLPGTTVYATPAGPWDRISDPSVGYDAKHGTWMISGLALTGTTGKAVLISRSTDGGLTWQNPVTVSQGGGGSFYDKEWVACDNTASSPNYGNCYVEWDDADAGNQLKMSRSTDGGQSWQASSVPSAGVLGGQPLALPSGTVVVPIENVFSGSIASFVSTNGGSSYTGPFTVSSINFHPPAGNIRDGEGIPSADVDSSGTVYVAWSDCRFRSGCQANDIVYSTSTNGTSWSSVKRVPIVPTTSAADLFIPGIGVDHGTGGSSAHVGVSTYGYTNGSCSTSTCKLIVAYTSSSDGGATWSKAVRVAGPMNLKGLPLTNQGYMVGDYMSTSFGSNGKAYPVFANATGSSCTLGQITSCHEPMAAPTNGLLAAGGTLPAVTGPVLGANPLRLGPGLHTAY